MEARSLRFGLKLLCITQDKCAVLQSSKHGLGNVVHSALAPLYLFQVAGMKGVGNKYL